MTKEELHFWKKIDSAVSRRDFHNTLAGINVFFHYKQQEAFKIHDHAILHGGNGAHQQFCDLSSLPFDLCDVPDTEPVIKI